MKEAKELTEASLAERYESIMQRAWKFAHEDNPKRVGWELHGNTSQTVITNPADIKPDDYYLREVYLTLELDSKLFDIIDFLPQFIETFLKGRTSLKNMMEVYTPENVELRLNEAETTLNEVQKEFDIFLARQ